MAHDLSDPEYQRLRALIASEQLAVLQNITSRNKMSCMANALAHPKEAPTFLNSIEELNNRDLVEAAINLTDALLIRLGYDIPKVTGSKPYKPDPSQLVHFFVTPPNNTTKKG